MPVIAVNLSQKTYSDIMSLVGRGLYSGPEQFLEIAAFNQLALERGLTPEDLLKGIQRPAAVAGRGEPAATPPKRHRPTDQRPAVGDSVRAAQPPSARRVAVGVDEEELRDVLSRFSMQPCSSLELEPSSPLANSGTERVWGQVNRLFPLKAACRWVAVAAARGRWPDMALVIEKLAPDAAVLGSALERADAHNDRKREEMMGTGLPRKGNLQSSDRFLSQFVARITRANRVYPGAISQYGLAIVSPESLQLTRWGLKLAAMENPILDGDFGKSSRALSEDEREFLRHQVWERVPAEKQDFTSVLRAIVEGSARPESLMSATRSEFPANWTDVAVRTHLYGILARLGDLGLVTKLWEGRTVKYKVADSVLGLLAAQPAGELK